MNFINLLYTQALPVMLFLIMMGLGLTLTLIDFKRVVVFPKAVSIGLIAQMLLMPLLAFSLAYLIGPPPEIALGLIILAACPSGVTANAYSFAARADLALCVTLAAITSLLIVVTLPFFTYFAVFYITCHLADAFIQTDLQLEVDSIKGRVSDSGERLFSK